MTEISVDSSGDKVEAADVLAAMDSFLYPEPEVPCRETGSLDMERVYAEDLYGTGEWWEVGVMEWHMPVYGLACKK